MLRLAAEAQELMRVQVACDMANYVPRQGFQRSQDWTLLLLGHFLKPRRSASFRRASQNRPQIASALIDASTTFEPRELLAA